MDEKMEGAEKIKEKILQESKAEAGKIIKSAEEEAKSIDDSNRKMIKEYKKLRSDEIESSIQLFRNKTMAQYRLKARREYLSERETLINNSIDKFIKSLNRQSQDYRNYLKRSFESAIKDLSGEIAVYCNKADKKIVSEVLKGALGSAEPKVALEAANIIGGLIIEDSSGKRVDGSLEIKLERIKGDLRQIIAKCL